MPRNNARPVSVPLPTLRLMLSAALNGKRVPKYLSVWLECAKVAKTASYLKGFELEQMLALIQRAGAEESELSRIYVSQISVYEIARECANGKTSYAHDLLRQCEERGLIKKLINGSKGHSSVYAIGPIPNWLEDLNSVNHTGKTEPKGAVLNSVNHTGDTEPKQVEIRSVSEALVSVSEALVSVNHTGNTEASNYLLINTQESNSPSASAPAIEGAERPLCMKCKRVMRYVETPYHDYRCSYCQETRSIQMRIRNTATDEEPWPK